MLTLTLVRSIGVSGGIAATLTFAEMVLAHGQVEVCCLVSISLKLLVQLDGGCGPCIES